MSGVPAVLAPVMAHASDAADDAAGPGCSRSPPEVRRAIMGGPVFPCRGSPEDSKTDPAAVAGASAAPPLTPRRWTFEAGTPKTAPVGRPVSGPRATGSSPGRGMSVERRFGAEAKGDVTLCVRLRPGPKPEACVVVEPKDCVRLRAVSAPGPAPGAFAGRYEMCEALYRCDHAFGPESTQEQVYAKAVAPIADAVIRGYNGAVIAYGQTGAGKTHTMVGGRTPEGRGVTPRVVADIFAGLADKASWMVAVTALEIYNERVRDLLSPSGTTSVEIHECVSEDQRQSFRCPDATMWPARSPADALAALSEVVRRRETAFTDMNDRSSRSHLVFTICVWQSDDENSTTLHTRLHLVDLAGSERLKRSAGVDSALGGLALTPRGGGSTPNTPHSARHSARSSGSNTPSHRSPRNSLGRAGSASTQSRPREQQRREAVDINKSLSQLALVIQRLTMAGPQQYVPYRDSMLTRLLAESFGGSSKTCLIIACSPLLEDREETRSSLDFGRRAKLVRNKPRINAVSKEKPPEVVSAYMSGPLPGVEVQPAPSQPSPGTSTSASAEGSRTQLVSASASTTSAAWDQASHGLDLSLLLPQPISEGMLLGSSASQAGHEDPRLQAALADAAEMRRENAELRQQLEEVRLRAALADAAEAEAAETRQLRERLIAHLQESSAMPCTSSRKAAEEAMRLEQEKAGAIAKFEEQIMALRLGWEDDVARLEAEKGAAARRVKACLARRYQEDAAQLREVQATALAQAEAEKNRLREELQHAEKEVLRLREQQASTEVQLAEARARSDRADWPEAPGLSPRDAAAQAASEARPPEACASTEPPLVSRRAWPEAPLLPPRRWAAEAVPSGGADVAAGRACCAGAAGTPRRSGGLDAGE
uniref:Kinesin-like protein n=1 Tax=Alexandrium monilatum TaxID=311494 RepID=A0A7S4QNC0_9DINO